MPFPLTRHILPLLIATTTTFGGIWPIFNAPSSMLEFGLPAHIARSPTAASPFILCSARTTTIGLMLFTFYARGEYAVVDTILAIIGGYLGIVDSAVWWKEGIKGKAIFRACSCVVIAGWGWFGMTQVRIMSPTLAHTFIDICEGFIK